jgi:NADP-dependent 3-hydroxy acid dehydrogenase YdfG
MGKLSNKTALITGGGSGIGLAAAQLFLDEGARVVIAGRDQAKLAAAAKACDGGPRLISRAADVGNGEQVEKLVKEATAAFGRIDILVNNAGINIKTRAFRNLTPQAWDDLIRINLTGTFNCMHAVFPQMLERKDGVIINISSISGRRAWPVSGSGYCASKFGMTALGICLGAEEKDSGIRVSTIFPGEVDTPIMKNRPTPMTEEHRSRILKSEDVAQAILFVATLPPHVSVPELVMTPTSSGYY